MLTYLGKLLCFRRNKSYLCDTIVTFICKLNNYCHSTTIVKCAKSTVATPGNFGFWTNGHVSPQDMCAMWRKALIRKYWIQLVAFVVLKYVWNYFDSWIALCSPCCIGPKEKQIKYYYLFFHLFLQYHIVWPLWNRKYQTQKLISGYRIKTCFPWNYLYLVL